MYVSDILKEKAGDLVTTTPDETVATTVRLLSTKRIGAVIVCDAAGAIVGMLSERDIVRGLATHGESVLNGQVRKLMTVKVVTCEPTDTIAEVMKRMTEGRFRHLPVVEGDALKGMISIGDVVKHRLEESEQEARVLRDYVVASR